MSNIPKTPEEYRRWWNENTDAPYGFCWCGCGKKTNIARTADTRRGHVAGEPMRYVPHHTSRAKPGRLYEIDPMTGCWEWRRSKSNGYGMMSYKGKYQNAHRVFYQQRYGPLPDHLHVDHLCRNKGCVNPDHLEAVTRHENARRGDNTKLNWQKAEVIRDLYSQGHVSQQQLAEVFGVKQSVIQKITAYKTWIES